MIKEVTYYDIICDRCGKSLTEESEMCYPDTESAEIIAKDSEWITIDGKHYCPDCYELDEVTDKYVPKKGDKNEQNNILWRVRKIPLRRYIRIWCLRKDQ